MAGDGSEPRYDGESMASKGIVALTVNYRLGAFGFMAHPDLTKESPHHGSGNYALLDQNAALQWVQKNIAAFGGDPRKVTIAGESAGAILVAAMVGSPEGKGLFQRAIAQSGAWMGLSIAKMRTLEQAEEGGKRAVGTHTIAELRTILREVLAADGPVVCNVAVIPDEDRLPRISSRPTATGSMVSTPLEDLFPYLPRDEFRKNKK